VTTSSKDFKVKNGLVVQGSSATVAGNNILTTASDIEDLANVDTTGLSDGDVLRYDGDLESWVPGQAASLDIEFSQQTASYTIALSDKNKMVEIDSSSSNTLTIPLNSSQAFPNGSQVTVLQSGTGQTTIAGDTGVTVDATPGLKLRARWSTATLIKRSENSWLVVGDLVV
jgi:archaellum component FlaF (FlaF/FlaG flagellin family)